MPSVTAPLVVVSLTSYERQMTKTRREELAGTILFSSLSCSAAFCRRKP